MVSAERSHAGNGEPPNDAPRVESVADLIDGIEKRRREGETITIGTVQEVAGSRAIGPLLLVPGLAAFSPLSGIPTMATIVGTIVALISIQLVVGRHHIWLPSKLRNAGITPERGKKAVRYLKPIADFFDRWSSRRLAFLTAGIGMRIAALACLLVAVSMPLLELVPMSATIAGFIIAVFGLALTARDGVLMAAGLCLVCAGAVGLLVFFFQ